jgi:starvation-inducible DNA-binding protein
MDELQNAAKIAFASEFSFFLKAQNFHWNVVGSDFSQYHKLFGKIYKEVYDSIDPFAENIRKLGTFVPASLTRFNMLSQIADEDNVIPKEQMVAELAADTEKLVKILKMVYDRSEAAGEHGFSNFLAERMDAYRKHKWMLTASLMG